MRCKPAQAAPAPGMPSNEAVWCRHMITLAKFDRRGFPISAVTGRAEPGSIPPPLAAWAAPTQATRSRAWLRWPCSMPLTKKDLLQRSRSVSAAHLVSPVGGHRRASILSWPTSVAWVPWWRSVAAKTATCSSPARAGQGRQRRSRPPGPDPADLRHLPATCCAFWCR